MNLFMVDARGCYWQGDSQTEFSLAKWEIQYVIEISPPYARAVNRNRGTFGGAFNNLSQSAPSHL